MGSKASGHDYLDLVLRVLKQGAQSLPQLGIFNLAGFGIDNVLEVVHHHHVASARECVQQSVHLGLDAGVWIPVNLIDVFGNVGRQPDRSAYR
jgi:hypothetical protein